MVPAVADPAKVVSLVSGSLSGSDTECADSPGGTDGQLEGGSQSGSSDDEKPIFPLAKQPSTALTAATPAGGNPPQPVDPDSALSLTPIETAQGHPAAATRSATVTAGATTIDTPIGAAKPPSANHLAPSANQPGLCAVREALEHVGHNRGYVEDLLSWFPRESAGLTDEFKSNPDALAAFNTLMSCSVGKTTLTEISPHLPRLPPAYLAPSAWIVRHAQLRLDHQALIRAFEEYRNRVVAVGATL